MVFRWPWRLSFRKTVSAPAAAPAAGAAAAGLEIRTPREILAAHEDLLRRLRLHAAADDAQFMARFEEPLLRLAACVNALPATAFGAFREPMGLFRAALETAYYAFQAADGRIFTGGEGVERRHAMEPRWRYACFLAGLFHPLGRTLERVVVVDAGGRTWPHGAVGLTEWAGEAGACGVFVSWAPADGEEPVGPSPAGLALLPEVAGAANLRLLREGAPEIAAMLERLAAGRGDASHIADQVVAGCWERIREREGPSPLRPESVVPLAGVTETGIEAARTAVASARAELAVAAPAADAPQEPHQAMGPQQAPPPPSRHAAYVPPEVREALASPMQVERLGQVVKAWRERGGESTTMRRVEEGAAIELAFLARQMPNVPAWVDTLAREGLVYAAPRTPGLRIQKVCMVDGHPPVPALVLSNLACRRLGL